MSVCHGERPSRIPHLKKHPRFRSISSPPFLRSPHHKGELWPGRHGSKAGIWWMGRPMGRLMWSLVMAGHGWSWQARRHVWIQHVFKPASTWPFHCTNSCAIIPWKVALWNRASNGNFQMIQNIQGRIPQRKNKKSCFNKYFILLFYGAKLNHVEPVPRRSQPSSWCLAKPLWYILRPRKESLGLDGYPPMPRILWLRDSGPGKRWPSMVEDTVFLGTNVDVFRNQKPKIIHQSCWLEL